MDTYPRQDDDVPNSREAREMHEIIEDIKSLVNDHGTTKDALRAYLDAVHEQVLNMDVKDISDTERAEIKQLIEKHPYFKNPCSYQIRLITIMKYLRKKGIDVRIKDIDLMVDEIIQTIDGVVRIEYGRYYRKRA